ncbi:hypothetical protein M1K46_19885 [Fictibacillus sp. WQ 8-8]|uniref:hypothetical protein n=1 Tax=Fictibacillus sp. WQ 8-8 TaxID=2938788 RepID=UPI00210D1260|nr:hypothetical protein [Fictibacillus sp. WQ 8-8]MCQ6267888.1 hypothetical protein [Fictibacillus sp. WQ 8-8]
MNNEDKETKKALHDQTTFRFEQGQADESLSHTWSKSGDYFLICMQNTSGIRHLLEPI